MIDKAIPGVKKANLEPTTFWIYVSGTTPLKPTKLIAEFDSAFLLSKKTTGHPMVF